MCYTPDSNNIYSPMQCIISVGCLKTTFVLKANICTCGPIDYKEKHIVSFSIGCRYDNIVYYNQC